jgi:hypothetical protein
VRDLTPSARTSQPGTELRGSSSAARALAGLLALSCLAGSGCQPFPFQKRDAAPPRVLHPQASQSAGLVWLQPRQAREKRRLLAPILLESGDRVETGPDGKLEILLPGAALRLYPHTAVQVLYAFEGRTAVSREVRVESGEALVRVLSETPFVVRTAALQIEPEMGSVVLVGSRNLVDHAVCYRGTATARNVRIRGQTIVRLAPGQHLRLEDAATVAYLDQREFPDEWARWERPDANTAGVVLWPKLSSETQPPTSGGAANARPTD